MKIVSTSYINTAGFNDPEKWLGRISFYTGILEELAKNHQVESIEQISYNGKMERKGVQYHFLNFDKRCVYFPFRLHRFIKKLSPDVVFVNGFIFPLQIIQLRLTLGSKARIIVINRAEKPGTGLRKYLQRLADRCVQNYLFTSVEAGAVWVYQGIINKKDKISEVIQASSFFKVMNKELAQEEKGITGTPVFLWVGRLNGNKDPLNVLKGFAEYLKQQPSAKLYMIYQTEELIASIKNLCDEDQSLQQSVKLVGEVTHTEMQYWYNSADFIISGSHSEGSGIAICEAMSCGCIPLVTNIPSFRKMTGPGKCGMLYEPGNVGSLLKALMQTSLLNMEEERIKTLHQFKEELSFEAIAEKINTIIKTREII